MHKSDINQSDLLLNLHNGIFEVPHWHGFLEQMRSLLVADHCSIYFRRRDVPPIEATALSVGSPRPFQLLHLDAATFHEHDPVPYFTLEVGRVYSLDEFLVPGEPQHELYRERYMNPSGINHKIIMRISDQDGYNAWFATWKRKPSFNVSDTVLLKALGPHLSLAMRTFALLERTRLHANIADEAIGRMNFGWFTLDGNGYIVDMDIHAEQLIKESKFLQQTSQGRLLTVSSQASQKLRAALHEYDTVEEARPRAIRLSDDPWIDMLLIPVRDKALSGARTPVAIAYIHGDIGARSQRIEYLIDLFGLSRTEAGLALSLSRGRTIAEAAQDLHLTIETARNYSKRIYSKTGARGQPDLVRIVLASVIALM
jgi:DNA-binding CsgD family transcriptional regulator